MEPFNTKLYEKYRNLKKTKFLEDEEWNHDRDAQVRKCLSDMEAWIETCNNANERLRAELYSLQNKFADCVESLHEEGKKCKELSEEVGRLHNCLFQKNDGSDSLMTSPSTTLGVRSVDISKNSQRHAPECEEKRTKSDETTIVACDSCNVRSNAPDCCRGDLVSSGNYSENCSTCVFQTFMRFLVGMDFSVDSQTENLRLLVVHRMSGYSFSLTWIQHEGEGEWMYQVSSLGTLESVALEWMKEEIMFTAAMCRHFFERVCRVIKHC